MGMYTIVGGGGGGGDVLICIFIDSRFLVKAKCVGISVTFHFSYDQMTVSELLFKFLFNMVLITS